MAGMSHKLLGGLRDFVSMACPYEVGADVPAAADYGRRMFI